MDGNQGNNARELLTPRPAREALLEIAGFSAAIVFFIGAFALMPFSLESTSRAFVWAAAAGATLLEHIGWGFGVAIPTLLGFFAIVAGGQLIGSRLESSTRRVLGGVAELTFAALVPALLLIVAACVQRPALAGTLFVIVPAYLLMLFLAVQLGGFAVFETEVRVAIAEATRTWAQRRIAVLARRSRRSPVPVVLVNGLLGAALATIATLAATAPGFDVLFWALFHLVTAMILTAITMIGRWRTLIARDNVTTAFEWLLLAVFYAGATAIAARFLTVVELRGGGVGMLVLIVFIALTSFWPRAYMRRTILDWSIHGAASRCAARSAARTLAKTIAQLSELNPPVELPEPAPSLLRRILNFPR